ncbi:MAG: MarR family transcriptional regulator [Enterovirga sp.]|nr:MarR family transcriptional regulator [Enterovirga sp.]
MSRRARPEPASFAERPPRREAPRPRRRAAARSCPGALCPASSADPGETVSERALSAARDARAAPSGEPAPRQGVDLGPLPDLVGYTLRRAQIAFFRSFARGFADLDIRPTQLGMLTLVEANPGIKQSDLAAALGIQRANIVPLIDGLAARGLLVRAKASADRRSHALRLTPAGRTLLAELKRREAALEGRVAAAIGNADRRRLVKLLAAVEEACREPEPDPD